MIRRMVIVTVLICVALSMSACARSHLGDLALDDMEVVIHGDNPQDWLTELDSRGPDGEPTMLIRVHVTSSLNLIDAGDNSLESRAVLCSHRNFYVGNIFVFWRGRQIGDIEEIMIIEPEEDGRYRYYFYIATRYTLDPRLPSPQGRRDYIEMSEHPVDVCARIITPGILPPIPSTEEIRIPAERIAALLRASAPP